MVTCVVIGCTNKSTKKSAGTTFHRFPVDSVKRAVWVKAVRRENWKPSKSSRLCSSHFEEQYIDRTSLSCVRLRENAIPTIFPSFSKCLEKVKMIPLGKPKLAKEAIPSGFPDCPSYVSKTTKKRHILQRDENICNAEQKDIRNVFLVKNEDFTPLHDIKIEFEDHLFTAENQDLLAIKKEVCEPLPQIKCESEDDSSTSDIQKVFLVKNEDFTPLHDVKDESEDPLFIAENQDFLPIKEEICEPLPQIKRESEDD